MRGDDGKNGAEADAAIVATYLMLAAENEGLATLWGRFLRFRSVEVAPPRCLWVRPLHLVVYVIGGGKASE